MGKRTSGKGRGGTGGALIQGLLAPVLVSSGLAAVGAVYQGVCTARDRRRYPPPGKLVEVEGRVLHLRENGKGSPTVLLETGLGGMSSAWGWLQPEIATFARVVSYDRPGLGWSPPDGEAPHAVRARRLYEALKKLGIPGPYLLVGHSMGGLLVRVFHDLYPDEVVGACLIDASHPDQHLQSHHIASHMDSGFRLLRNVQLLTRIGYVRFSDFFAGQAEGLPLKARLEARSFLCSSGHLKCTHREASRWDELCAEVRATRGLGTKPLAVVSAGKGILPGARRIQKELASLSANSRHVVVDEADHVTLVTHREHALVVAAEIRRLIEAVSGALFSSTKEGSRSLKNS